MVLRPTRRRNRGGFTLMEMLVVVAIIVMLAGVSTYGYMKYLEGAKESSAKIQIQRLSEAVEAYKVQHDGNPPGSLAELTVPEGTQPAALEQKELIDPWNMPYQYEPANTSPTGRSRVYSQHPSSTGGALANW
jgi:general secretion pathway protein G